MRLMQMQKDPVHSRFPTKACLAHTFQRCALRRTHNLVLHHHIRHSFRPAPHQKDSLHLRCSLRMLHHHCHQFEELHSHHFRSHQHCSHRLHSHHLHANSAVGNPAAPACNQMCVFPWQSWGETSQKPCLF